MPKRILVVDDDENILSLERTILEQKGFHVTTAGGGEDALKLLREQAFDLVLLDVMMPDKDGFEVCRQIKQDARTKTVPVIFLTAKGGRRGARRGLRVRRGDVHQQALHREQAAHHREHDARAGRGGEVMHRPFARLSDRLANGRNGGSPKRVSASPDGSGQVAVIRSDALAGVASGAGATPPRDGLEGRQLLEARGSARRSRGG